MRDGDIIHGLARGLAEHALHPSGGFAEHRSPHAIALGVKAEAEAEHLALDLENATRETQQGLCPAHRGTARNAKRVQLLTESEFVNQ